MKKLSKDIQDVLLMIALQGLNYIAPILVYPYLMIVLGAEQFGVVSFSLSFAQYFMLIVDFGFNLSATKRIAQSTDTRERNRIFTSTIIAKTVLLVLCALILFVISGFNLFPAYQHVMWIMFLMVIANTYFFIWFFQGIGKIKIITTINVVSKLLILPLTFMFVKSAGDYRIAAFILSVSYLLGMVINIVVIIRYRYAKLIKVDYPTIKLEMKESFPVFLSTASTSIYTSFFVVLLGIISTPMVVGLYSSAEKIMRSVCFLFVAPISQVFYPKIAKLSLYDRVGAGVLYRKILKYTMLWMTLMAVLLVVFGGHITSFLGAEYEAATPYLQIISIALLFIPLGAISGQLGLLAMGDNLSKNRYKRVYIIAAPVSLLLVMIFATLYSGIGAVIALVITEAFVGLMMYYYFKKTIRW